MRPFVRAVATMLWMLVLLAPAVAPAAVDRELLYNPGLEAAGPSGSAPAFWTASTWGNGGPLPNLVSFSWPTDAHDGARSVRVDVTSYTDGGDSKWVHGAVPVTGGAHYAFSDWYKSNRNSAVSVYFETATDADRDGDGLVDGHWANLFAGIAPASEWTQFSTGFTMPAGAVRAHFVHFIAGAGYLQTDDYSMKLVAAPPGFSRPMVSLTFDDGSQASYDTALPLLDARGFRTTQYIPTAGLDPPDGWMMTAEEIREIAREGHEIGSHSVTHPHLPGIGDLQLGAELSSSRAFLEAITGVPGSVVNLAYPFGEYDARVIEAAKASGYRSGRSVEEGYNSRFDLERFDIRVQNVTRDTTIDEFRSWVDYAEEHRYWLVLVYHEVVPDSAPVCTDPETVDPCLGAYHTTVSRFQAQLSYIDAQLGAGNVLTVEQALAAAEADIHAPLAGTVTMTPAQPRRGSVVTATPSGFTDPDGGALTFRFRWRVNGIAIGGATQPTLDLSQRAGRGDVVAVGVVAEDGDGHSSAEVGSSVTVANTPPTTGSVAIYPSAPAAGVTLTATPSGFVDPDGDALTFAYTWLRNGQVVPGATGPSPAAAAVAAGDTLRVDTRASDGHGGESGPAAATVTVHGATPASPAQVADRSGPTITIRSPRARTYGLGSKLTISFRCRDSSGVTRRKATLRRRGGRLRSVKPGKRVRLERAGRYVLRVTATDANGNTAARTVAFRVAKR